MPKYRILKPIEGLDPAYSVVTDKLLIDAGFNVQELIDNGSIIDRKEPRPQEPNE